MSDLQPCSLYLGGRPAVGVPLPPGAMGVLTPVRMSSSEVRGELSLVVSYTKPYAVED